nr:S8 family peptidase [Burkholderia singularis]
MCLLGALSGCGGGDGSTAPSPAAQPMPAPFIPAPMPASAPAPSPPSQAAPPNTAASCTATQTPSNAHSTSVARASERAPASVDHLIVKLREAAAAPVTSAAAPAGAHILAEARSAARIDAVIRRVAARWSGKQGAVSAYAQRSASGSMQAERTISDGALLIALGQKLNADTADTLAQAFASDPDVAYAEPDHRVFAHATPTDPAFHQQWNASDPTAGIDLPAAWSITAGSSAIVTAVLDTGYRPHPDLAANLLPGYDFISDIDTGNNGHGRGPDATDPGDWLTQQELSDPASPFYHCASTPSNSSWHGTAVTGIVGAAANNGIGIAGVNWYGKVLPVRVLGKCGGTTSDIADAMRWAAGLPVAGAPLNTTPAKVITLSLGGTGPCGETFQQAIDDVTAQRATVIVAAGNDGRSTTLDRPANCKGVIAVGATDHTGLRAWYSNFGAYVTLSAPGTDILSTSNTGTTAPAQDTYSVRTGTSFAAPQVAGVAALMLAANPALTPAQIAQKLTRTARASAASAPCLARAPGAGIVDAGQAVASATP